MGSRAQSERESANLTAICEPIAYTMWYLHLVKTYGVRIIWTNEDGQLGRNMYRG
jgi:hypothetical protein